MRSVRQKFVPLYVALLFLLLSAGISRAAESGEIRLDADSISYEESTGIAVAEGNARVADGELLVTAPRMEYYSMSQSVTAFASPTERVVLLTGGKRVEGDRLDYDIATRKGTMIKPDGKVDLYYVKGGVVDVMPKSKIPTRRRAPASAAAEEDEDLAAVWKDAVCTTCGLSHPHYRLQSKTVTVYPGDKMILHRARVYIGHFLAMASPFDIMISLKDRVDQKIFPRLGYDSEKGVGLGVSGSVGWKGGSLALDFIGWSEGIFEMDALAVHQIAAGLSVYGGIRRAYDKDLDEAEWRPRWGASYAWRGWTLSAGWTKHELLSVERRAGEVLRYELERKPEISLYSPWYGEKIAGGRFRIFGLWGSYRDTRGGMSDVSYNRTGLGFQVAGEPWAKKGFTPFYNATYQHFMYDDDILDEQKVLDARVGLLFQAGSFDFSTAYLRQWAWGASPLMWDRYGDRDELYQEIGFRVPTNNPDYSWKLGMRAAYDIASDELAEMVYKVSYQHHCLVWNAVYRDDVRGDDDWMGLHLSVRDLPNGSIRLFGDNDSDLSDPFAH
jgi:LPS-assembly protein